MNSVRRKDEVRNPPTCLGHFSVISNFAFVEFRNDERKSAYRSIVIDLVFQVSDSIGMNESVWTLVSFNLFRDS